jgi:T5SS/PEP-CTERM-associated repeat protein
VSNAIGYLGYRDESTGRVSVDGAGSTWTNNGDLSVGYYGNGALRITDGGAVSSHLGWLGHHNDAIGVATVAGPGSTWTNSDELRLGYTGDGMLTIANGGAVSAKSVTVDRNSLLAIEVSGGSQLIIDGGSGTFTNDGALRIIAGPRPTAGAVHAPISAGVWIGS